MGGTINSMVANGRRVVHLVMICDDYRNSARVKIDAEARMDDASVAADELGMDLFVFQEIPENQGPQYSDLLVAEIDAWLKELQPCEVYTCLPWFNVDHDAVYKATVAAMRRHFSCPFWAYEMPQQELGFQVPEHGWLYNPLSEEDMAAKRLAIMAYDPTQKLVTKPGPVSMRGAEALARLRGVEVGYANAERFLLLRG